MQLSSCSDNIDSAGKNVFLLNLSSASLESMDPAYAKDLYMMWTANMVYNTLVATDENIRLTPSLAKSWEVSEDGLTHTFHLRSDVYFQDNDAFENGKGRKMVATDVVYSFGRIIDPKVASYGAWIFNDRVAKENPFVAIDDTTFQIKLLTPFKPLVEILSMKYCSIVPKEVVEKWGKDFRAHACGTGPFMVSDWEEGSMLLLHKNPNYWERDKQGNQLPYIDAIKTTFVDSKATEFFLFLQGKLDFVNGIDGSFKDLVLTKRGALKEEFMPKINLTKRPYLNTEYIGFLTDTTNEVMKGAATKNVLVRQAINYAIDREKIVTYFRNGAVTPALSGFIPKGMPGYDTTHNYGYTYNPQKSLELLAEAGYPNGKGLESTTILTPDNYADIVNFIANQLQEVGIPIQVEIIQANLLRQQMSRSKAPMFRAQWIADYPDAETYLVFFKGDIPAPPNYTRFKNATYDSWYNKAMNAPDSERFALYRSMDSLAIRNAPLIPLFYDQMLHFTSKRVTGMQSTPMNVIDLKSVRLN